MLTTGVLEERAFSSTSGVATMSNCIGRLTALDQSYTKSIAVDAVYDARRLVPEKGVGRLARTVTT